LDLFQYIKFHYFFSINVGLENITLNEEGEYNSYKKLENKISIQDDRLLIGSWLEVSKELWKLTKQNIIYVQGFATIIVRIASNCFGGNQHN